MLTVSGLCGCPSCTERTTSIYRMIGSCRNCGQRDILMLFRSGDPSRSLDCPVCGNYWTVNASRLATEDEISAAEPCPS